MSISTRRLGRAKVKTTSSGGGGGGGGGTGSPLNTNLDDITWKAVALALTSTAENSTTDWTSQYGYIEDIADGRGYTAGIVGFCSGTGDMLVLVNYSNTIQPNNILMKYVPALEAVNGTSSHSGLDPNFPGDWATASSQSWFQRAQRDERDRVYWNPAFAAAKRDGLSALGLALYYDVSVNHGPGTDSQSFDGILVTAKNSAPPPSSGGNEATYLRAICTARDNVLRQWGDYQTNGRSTIFLHLIDTNFTLRLPISWSVYGGSFTLTQYPTAV